MKTASPFELDRNAQSVPYGKSRLVLLAMTALGNDGNDPRKGKAPRVRSRSL
ncbi:MAG: hypothetical protein LBF83_10990 [Spirochaetaceae bacterium]|nr:hypothetical protein [Spirochaetaceae bacterium]